MIKCLSFHVFLKKFYIGNVPGYSICNIFNEEMAHLGLGKQAGSGQGCVEEREGRNQRCCLDRASEIPPPVGPFGLLLFIGSALSDLILKYR